MADTDISLSVGLDVRDAEKTAKDLQKEVRKIFDSRDGEQSAALTNLELQMKKTAEQSENLQMKIAGVRSELDSLSDMAGTSALKHLDELSDAFIRAEADFASVNKSFLAAKNALYQDVEVDVDGLTMSLAEVTAKVEDESLSLSEHEYYHNIWAKAIRETGRAMDEMDVSLSGNIMKYSEAKELVKQYSLAMVQARDEYRNYLKTVGGEEGAARMEEERAAILAENSEKQEALNAQLKDYTTQLDLVNDKQKQQIIRHDEMTDKEVANYERIQDAAERAGEAEELRQMKTETTEMRHGFASATRSVMGLNLAVRGVGRLIPGVSTRVASAIASASRGVLRLASLTKRDLKNAVQSLSSVVMKLLTSLMSHPVILAIVAALGVLIVRLVRLKKMLDMAKKALHGLAKTALDFLKALPRRLANLAKLVVGIGTAVERYFIKGVAVLIQKLSSLKGVVSENLKYMVQWNKGVNDINKSMSNLTSSVAYLKGTITTAVVPIINFVEPVLTKITDRLAEVATSVGMFIAQLTGQKTFQRAIREQKDYAEALRGTNKQLASFDKLNVINDSKGGEDDFPIKFEEIDVEPLNLHIIEELFDKAQEMAEKFTKTLNDIPWGTIKQGASDASIALSNFANGFIETDGLGASLGLTLGNLFETVQTFFDGLFDEHTGIKFDKLGKQFGDFFINAIGTIKWEDLAKRIWKGFRAALKIVRGFLKSNPGTKLGKAFSDFLSTALNKDNIPWTDINETITGIVTNIADFFNTVITPENFEKIGTTLGGVMNTVVTAAKTFADEVEWKQWGTSLSEAINSFFSTWDMKLTADAINRFVIGLEEGLLAAITGDGNGNKGIDFEMIGDKIVELIAGIDWESISAYALQISQKLRDGLNVVWKKLKDIDAFDEIIEMLVDFFNEKREWDKLFRQIKWDIIRKALIEAMLESSLIYSIGKFIAGSITDWITSGGKLTKEEILGKYENDSAITSYVYANAKGGTAYTSNMIESENEKERDRKETKEQTETMEDIDSHLLEVLEEIGSQKIYDLTRITFSGSLGSLTEAERKRLYYLLRGKGYASGTVIPPSASEFLAKVGDNNRETEVISPLSTIKQALAEALSEQNINVTFQVEGDPNGLFRVVQKESTRYNKRTGLPAFS